MSTRRSASGHRTEDRSPEATAHVGSEALEPPHGSALSELVGLAMGIASLPSLAVSREPMPRGDGKTVLVLPGFLTGDGATVAIRRYLSSLGYGVHGWKLGRNNGDTARLVPRVIERLEAITRGRRAHVVGWSHGGVLAREATRERPDLVQQVITMGTPIIGGPKYTRVADRYAERGVDLDALERTVAQRNAVPLRVPVMAIYSKRDAVVAWRACLDPNPENHTEHVEVDVGHAAMGFSPAVLRIVAARLAT